MRALLAILLCLLVQALQQPVLAQSGPRPAAPLSFTVTGRNHPSARACGYTHNAYLSQGRYPLVVILAERDPAGVIASLPHRLLDRKRMLVVAVEISNAELAPEAFLRLLQLVSSTVTIAGKTWSMDPQRVLLLGMGTNASRALAIARSGIVAVRGAIAWGPTDAWQPEAATARPPMLVISTNGKDKAIAESLAIAARCRAFVHEHGKPGELALAMQPVMDWMERRLRPEATGAEPMKDRIAGRTSAASGSKQRVVVIKGDFDSVEQVLEQLEIPHLEIRWTDFLKFDLAESDVLLINCSNGQDYEAIKKAAAEKLRQFVNQGGCIFTTDWALRYPLVDVIGDCIECLQPDVEQAMVDVRPGPKMYNHELLQNVFPLDQPAPQWRLDASSWLVKVKVPGRVDLLLQSDQMAAAHHGNRAIGVLARVGTYGGLVLNVVSHFLVQGDGDSATPMYQLIVNFINKAAELRENRRGR
jgi:hypothetical protein